MACLTPLKLSILPQTVNYVLNLFCKLCLEPAPIGVGVVRTWLTLEAQDMVNTF